MDRSVDIAAVEHVAVEIEEVTPREAGKLETEAKCNDNNGTIVTESEAACDGDMIGVMTTSNPEETKANNDISWVDCLCGPEIYVPPGDTAFNIFSLWVLLGAFVFGLVEIFLGSQLFNTFKHVRLGAWWVGVAGWASFILIYSYRLNFSLFMSFCMAGIAFYGAFLDARSSQHFSSITACASQVDFNSEITYYGKSSDFPAARSCFNSTEFTVLDGCYCVSNNDPGTCNEYITNAFFKNNNGKGKNMVYYTCYETVKIFSGRMTASCVFCCLLLFVAILQILIVCLLYPKRKPGVYIVKDQLSVREIEA